MSDARPRAAGPEVWALLRKPLELELARGCQDTTILGGSIGAYAQGWALRVAGAGPEDTTLARSLARGLRDYAEMAPPERKRRVMAALDMLRRREGGALPDGPKSRVQGPKSKAKGSGRRAAKGATPPAREDAAAREDAGPPITLPGSAELLAMPLTDFLPRARWPGALGEAYGLYTVRDLLNHIPRAWIPICRIADAPDGARVALVGTVLRRQQDRLSTRRERTLYKYTLEIKDETGEAWIVSFAPPPPRGNQGGAWAPGRMLFSENARVFVLGKVDRAGKLVQVSMEEIHEVSAEEETDFTPGAMIPLYALTEGVHQTQVSRAIKRALARLEEESSSGAVPDPLPESLRARYDLPGLVEAWHDLHLPAPAGAQERARRRMAFEEFLVPQLVLAQRRRQTQHEYKGTPLHAPVTLPALAAEIVSFPLTFAQMRVLVELEEDLRAPHAMNRLLQGDVGSGKTVVAALAIAYAVQAGVQAAVMAPTEILAEQLYIVLSHLLTPRDVKLVLLTGSLSAEARRKATLEMETGAANVAVGTHALIQGGVTFQDLGLVVVDEQHRFGVLQRAALREKGRLPNALVMTATPIPRTLALTVYGDLDLSVLNELPPGRHPIRTVWMADHELQRAYDLIRAEVSAGRQAYVVCPLVEQSDLLQADAAVSMAEELKTRVFPDLRVGLLHGRMRPDEKDAAMEAFRRGETQVLTCTVVIEVGVDVPNATVMLIHGAQRFGLAQLHQLRGRVGRSSYPSTCLLVTPPRFDPARDDGEETSARQRLRVLLEEQDGFRIAEADLEIRGPGETLGTRQSGLTDFHVADLARDAPILERAREAAKDLIARDPDLELPEHEALRSLVVLMAARLEVFRE